MWLAPGAEETYYWILTKDIRNKGDLLHWVCHLAQKRLTQSKHLVMFIHMVCKVKGWEIPWRLPSEITICQTVKGLKNESTAG
jgi:hypothetical protein